MTIAIGLIAKDGVVIAADTQEIVGSHKTDEPKILVANQGSKREQLGAMAITGAGDSGYLDSINQEVCGAFLTKKVWKSGAWYAKAKQSVRQFHYDHVAPFAQFPNHDRPELKVIIGTQVGDSSSLWSTEKSTLSNHARYCAVGLGRPYAQVMFRRFWKSMDTVKAASLAAFVVFHVKNTVDGCGNQTQIVIIKNGFAEWISQDNIDLLENAFYEYARHENLMLHFILGLDLRQSDMRNELAVFSASLKKDRDDIAQAQQLTLTSFHAGEAPLDQPSMVRRPKK